MRHFLAFILIALTQIVSVSAADQGQSPEKVRKVSAAQALVPDEQALHIAIGGALPGTLLRVVLEYAQHTPSTVSTPVFRCVQERFDVHPYGSSVVVVSANSVVQLMGIAPTTVVTIQVADLKTGEVHQVLPAPNLFKMCTPPVLSCMQGNNLYWASLFGGGGKVRLCSLDMHQQMHQPQDMPQRRFLLTPNQNGCALLDMATSHENLFLSVQGQGSQILQFPLEKLHAAKDASDIEPVTIFQRVNPCTALAPLSHGLCGLFGQEPMMSLENISTGDVSRIMSGRPVDFMGRRLLQAQNTLACFDDRVVAVCEVPKNQRRPQFAVCELPKDNALLIRAGCLSVSGDRLATLCSMREVGGAGALRIFDLKNPKKPLSSVELSFLKLPKKGKVHMSWEGRQILIVVNASEPAPQVTLHSLALDPEQTRVINLTDFTDQNKWNAPKQPVADK